MNRLRVLTYHRIADLQTIRPNDPRLVSASPAEFERQITWLARNFTVIDIGTVLEAATQGTRLPSRAVLITFDDAYPDFGSTAWPILKAHRAAATLFVPTDFPGRPGASFWWDALNARLASTTLTRLSVDPLGELPLGSEMDRRRAASVLREHVKTLPHDSAMKWLESVKARIGGSEAEAVSILTWDELRKLASDGVSIGAHSRSHSLLTGVPIEKLEQEIAGSVSDLERELGSQWPIFCYPAGAYNRQVTDAARQAGIRLAFSTRTGHNNLDRDELLSLRRLNVTPKTTMGIFQLKLSVPGGFADRLRKSLSH